MVTRWRINKVDRPEYYEWDYEGVLVLAGRRRTPPGVVVTTDCQTLDPRRLPESAFSTGGGPAAFHRRYWAKCRTRSVPRSSGWRGSGPANSRGAGPRSRPSSGNSAPSTPSTGMPPRPPTIPPRCCGSCPSRGAGRTICSPPPPQCYYARSITRRASAWATTPHPDAYDPETAHTPVRASDLHFWPELLLRDGQWLVVEPTPGYEVLGPALPLSERTAERPRRRRGLGVASHHRTRRPRPRPGCCLGPPSRTDRRPGRPTLGMVSGPDVARTGTRCRGRPRTPGPLGREGATAPADGPFLAARSFGETFG